MKIIDLIQSCDKLFPNEFDFCEKLAWCDELGALLTREHFLSHEIVRPEVKNGVYTLPVDFAMCDIDRIIIGGRVIKKNDLPRAQIYLLNTDNGVVIKGDGVSSSMKVMCRPRYKKIRHIELVGVKISIRNDVITMAECPFVEGDVLEIGIEGETEVAVVRDIKMDANMRFEIRLDKTLQVQGGYAGDIKRVITDKTVCAAPFDTMYYDFINAKVCFYQRDYDSYNKHMAVFNSRLEDYDRFIIKHNNSLPDTRVANWW